MSASTPAAAPSGADAASAASERHLALCQHLLACLWRRDLKGAEEVFQILSSAPDQGPAAVLSASTLAELRALIDLHKQQAQAHDAQDSSDSETETSNQTEDSSDGLESSTEWASSSDEEGEEEERDDVVLVPGHDGTPRVQVKPGGTRNGSNSAGAGVNHKAETSEAIRARLAEALSNLERATSSQATASPPPMRKASGRQSSTASTNTTSSSLAVRPPARTSRLPITSKTKQQAASPESTTKAPGRPSDSTNGRHEPPSPLSSERAERDDGSDEADVIFADIEGEVHARMARLAIIRKER